MTTSPGFSVPMPSDDPALREVAGGAAATDENVAEAAIPFDRRRHGMLIGMGAAALVVESADAARERGIQPICEVLSAVSANSTLTTWILTMFIVRPLLR